MGGRYKCGTQNGREKKIFHNKLIFFAEEVVLLTPFPCWVLATRAIRRPPTGAVRGCTWAVWRSVATIPSGIVSANELYILQPV